MTVAREMQQAHDGRERMEQARGAARTECTPDSHRDCFHIQRHLDFIVLGEAVPRIPAMIALVIENHLAVLQESAPERKIGVDGEAVAVRQHQPRPARIAVAADTEARAVRHVHIENRKRRRQAGSN